MAFCWNTAFWTAGSQQHACQPGCQHSALRRSVLKIFGHTNPGEGQPHKEREMQEVMQSMGHHLPLHHLHIRWCEEILVSDFERRSPQNSDSHFVGLSVRKKMNTDVPRTVSAHRAITKERKHMNPACKKRSHMDSNPIQRKQTFCNIFHLQTHCFALM